MNESDDQRAKERMREQALEIISENLQRQRLKETNERLLDQEALRQAAIRAGLEEP